MRTDRPGDTAERHTDALLEVVGAGHEIGQHGHLHLHLTRTWQAGWWDDPTWRWS